MLLRRCFLLGCLILFAGTSAKGEIDDEYDAPPNDQRAPLPPPALVAPKVDSSQNRPPPVKSNVEQKPVVAAAAAAPARPPAPSQAQRAASLPPTPLGTSAECKSDVQRYCTNGADKIITNLKVLQCVDELDNAVNLISKPCQHLIYSFKYNMTHDARFDDAAMKQCEKDIKQLDECNEHTDERGTGRLVSCLYDRLPNITEPSCRYFINQMQSVVFNDWRLTEYFSNACNGDITKFECGRLDDDNKNIPHEQGAVVSCLSSKYNVLAPGCRKEIFRLAEMQSDDYHLDRALYYACRDDRDRLCAKVPSGNGRVYRCLYEQKFNTMMSLNCRKEVHRRQSLVVANVNLDVPLIRACRAEMAQHKCVVKTDSADPQTLMQLLLCLEDTLKKGQHIQDDCRREMLVHRRMLMSDHELSPEIQDKCKKEMVEHCVSLYQKGASGNNEQRGGRMIHCLLSAARKEPTFSKTCLSAVKSLVRAVDPGNDIRADPLLETTCRPVIDILCPRVKAGDSNVIMCLLDNLKNPRMTEECEDRLMEVAYFMARDWRLTPRLLRTCRTDLVTHCHLPTDWSMSQDMDDVQVGMYLGCLYQKRQLIARECRSELKRIMNIRGQSIGLLPEIEDNCIQDLATCKGTDVKGEELKCLQEKYDSLDAGCKAAVRNFTQITMDDPTLDFLLMKACEPMIQSFCSNIEAGRENDLIRCLVRHKNEREMNIRCKAGIDHHQITSMKDGAFLSAQFRTRCTKEIDEHCKGKSTKALVIQCLADLMLQDALKKTNYITESCRDELKFELLQRGENIEFDPSLAKDCKGDIEKFCSDRSPGNAQILDCLKENYKGVSAKCYTKLRRREKLDVVLPENDYSLMTKCASVIQKFCANEKRQNILSCLRRNANEGSMPNMCRRVLYLRLMVLNSDPRFNKALIDNCKQDIVTHCKSEILDNDDDDGKDSDEDGKGPNGDGAVDRELGARVIQCLRDKYTDTHITLQSQCVAELVDIIQTSKLDVSLDPKLYQSCRTALTSVCTGMDKEDCLKLRYQKGEIVDPACKEQIKRIIREGQADIHVDRALAFACQTDTLKYCNDIPIGSGKQLQCLLSTGKYVTAQCREMLQKRQELWKSVSNFEGVADIAREIRKSNNSTYLFSAVLLIFCVMFMAGCACRPYVRYSRVRKSK